MVKRRKGNLVYFSTVDNNTGNNYGDDVSKATGHPKTEGPCIYHHRRHL